MISSGFTKLHKTSFSLAASTPYSDSRSVLLHRQLLQRCSPTGKLWPVRDNIGPAGGSPIRLANTPILGEVGQRDERDRYSSQRFYFTEREKRTGIFGGGMLS